MDTLIFVMNAVLPAFIIIGLGALAGRTMPALDPLSISRLAMYYTTPALIINTIIHAELPTGRIGLISAGYLVTMAALAGVARLFTLRWPRRQRQAALASTLFANTGNMGLSMSLFAYGQAGLERSVIIFVLSMLLMFTLGPALLSSSDARFSQRLLQSWKLPPVWAALVGVALNLTQAALPTALDRVLGLLASAVVPIMLLLLGIQISRTWSWSRQSVNWTAVGLKVAAAPVIAWLLGAAVGLRGLDLAVLTLSFALPTAVSLFSVAVEVEGDHDQIGKTIFTTTLLGAVGICVVLFLFHGRV